MTRPISDPNAPPTRLRRELRALVARQRAQGTALADRLTAVLAPTQPDTTPEEGQ